MKVVLLRGLTRAIAALPLNVVRRLGAGVGRLAWLLRLNARYDTQTNLALCFPERRPRDIERLARESLIDTGRMLLEAPWIWGRDSHELLSMIEYGAARALIRERLAEGRGLILASPHFGNWELCPAPLAPEAPFHFFYKPRRIEDSDTFITTMREGVGGKALPLSSRGIRDGLAALRRGEMLGILPDQEPDTGVFVPLFAEPAMTMTLISKLAGRCQSPVLFCAMERNDHAGRHGKPWIMHAFDADESIRDPDPAVAARTLNRHVEQCAMIQPAQYLWDYRRFATLPSGKRRDYRGARAALKAGRQTANN